MNSMSYISSIPRSRSFGPSPPKERDGASATADRNDLDDAPIKQEADLDDDEKPVFPWTGGITAEPAEYDDNDDEDEEDGEDEGKLDVDVVKREGCDDSNGLQEKTRRSRQDEGVLDEKTPLLSQSKGGAYLSILGEDDAGVVGVRGVGGNTLSRRIAGSLLGTFRVIVSTILAPGKFLLACFYDEDGRFSAMMPIYRLQRKLSRRQRKRESRSSRSQSAKPSKAAAGRRKDSGRMPYPAINSSEHYSFGSNMPSDETPQQLLESDDTPSRHTRSKSPLASSHPTPMIAEDADQAAANATSKRAAPRIKLLSAEPDRPRKHGQGRDSHLIAANIKSPTSPTSSLRLTRYPRAPLPPRPLIPRRQPSYAPTINPIPSLYDRSQKTLIIDLDETLIHSMAKGGRMSTGHMVEVKLQSPMGPGGTLMAPQVPILYYVHKRPNCDEFLRKVSKWYNLIVFTASVQEYADPVIDWLELERKYFSARYYRQHCTYRNGAYIKDLSVVEPDLSKVMILDNSPMSYIFHEDNAIPIEGWISDPTDNDLLHLIPLLEGLQYTTDVRALLALRLGEASTTGTANSPTTAGSVASLG